MTLFFVIICRDLLRDDPRALGAEGLIAVRVVEMPVRVDHEVDLAAAELADPGLVLRHHLRELIVDEQYAVRADRRDDVAAHAEQHVEVVRELLRRDRRGSELLVEVVELRRDRRGRREHETNRYATRYEHRDLPG